MLTKIYYLEILANFEELWWKGCVRKRKRAMPDAGYEGERLYTSRGVLVCIEIRGG